MVHRWARPCGLQACSIFQLAQGPRHYCQACIALEVATPLHYITPEFVGSHVGFTFMGWECVIRCCSGCLYVCKTLLVLL